MNKVNVVCATIVLAGSIFVTAKTHSQGYGGSVCFGIKCFSVEIADTDIKHKQGLMFRKNLNKNTGMLFVFKEEGIHGFWMKNTYIPLGIIWMNKDKEIVFIKSFARSCSENRCSPVFPTKPALYVLEINAMESVALGLRIGDKAVFNIK